MRFMVFVVLSGQGKSNYENGVMPTESEINAMMKYNEELANSGIMLGGDGLFPPGKGVRIEWPTPGAAVDGPFAETKEVVGGYWHWNVASREEAISWAKKCPMQPGDILELRQIFEMSDFDIPADSEVHAQVERVDAAIEKTKSAIA